MFLIIYTLIWLTILGGLVYSHSNLASLSKDADWLAVRTCGTGNEAFNMYANRVFMIRKSAIQVMSHVFEATDGEERLECSQILMVGNHSINIHGQLERIMDRIDPDNDLDEERWK